MVAIGFPKFGRIVLDSSDELSETAPMPTATPKFRNQGEARCWTANQAAALNRFNWPAKKKVNLDYLSKLTSQIADGQLLEYRKRVKS